MKSKPIVRQRFMFGQLVWFLKSMRVCRVVEFHNDGRYTVEVVPGGKRLLATEEGLSPSGENSAGLFMDSDGKDRALQYTRLSYLTNQVTSAMADMKDGRLVRAYKTLQEAMSLVDPHLKGEELEKAVQVMDARLDHIVDMKHQSQ